MSVYDAYGNYDPEADALYISVRPGRIARQVALAPEVIVDVTEKDDVVGVEVLYPERNLTLALAWLRARGLAPAPTSS